MMNEEVAKYRELSGDTNPNTPISRIGGYLDGYEKALEQEAKWIPVSEKLPKQGVKVLVQRNDEIEVGYFDGYYEREYWQNGIKDTATNPHWWYSMGRLSTEHPVAWMPLPEPYNVNQS